MLLLVCLATSVFVIPRSQTSKRDRIIYSGYSNKTHLEILEDVFNQKECEELEKQGKKTHWDKINGICWESVKDD